jgi:hypothetical protein
MEIDSNGLNRLYPMIGRNYSITELFHNIGVICSKQIISLRQAKKVARPYLNDYKYHSKESILKYNIRDNKFYWELKGYKLLNERIILVDAISGCYTDSWDEDF